MSERRGWSRQRQSDMTDGQSDRGRQAGRQTGVEWGLLPFSAATMKIFWLLCYSAMWRGREERGQNTRLRVLGRGVARRGAELPLSLCLLCQPRRLVWHVAGLQERRRELGPSLFSASPSDEWRHLRPRVYVLLDGRMWYVRDRP